MKALRKPLSLFMARLMCLGIFAGNWRFRCSPSPHLTPAYHLNSLKKKIFEGG